jgi:glutamate synthase domain-containing protein 3
MISQHQAKTGSAVAADLLSRWDACRSHFVKVMPRDYKEVLAKRAAAAKEAVHG